MTETQTVNVLLIEDNPGDTRLMSEWLYSIPFPQFEVEVRDTLAAGITYLQQKSVDVVLLDLSLPDSTGVETVRRTRSEATDVAIVVTTGFDNRQSGIDAVKAGAQDYLVKGNFDPSLLERALVYAIERQRDAAALRRSEEEYRSLINDVFNNSTVAVFILDKTLRVVWMNDASEEYFQLPRERALAHEWDILLETHFARILGSSIRVQDSLLELEDDRTECYIKPQNGHDERWLEYTMKPIHAGMYAGGYIVQFTDITRMKHSEEAEHRQRLLAEALRDTAGALSSTLELDEVLDRILESLASVMQHDGANVMLLEENTVFIVREHPSGANATSTPSKNIQRITDLPYLQYMLSTDQALVNNDIAEDARWQGTPERQRWHAYAGAPIRLEDEIIGFINLYSNTKGYYGTQDSEQLEVFSRQAAVAMRNAQLYQKTRELATIQERQRLARDLHDAVTQTLFTSTMMADSALRQWHRPERAKELLQQVHQLTTGALAEMRVLLLELRPNTLVNVSLDQLLEQYVLSLQARGQIKVVLKMDPVPMLLPDVKIAFYRIVQEALNNITKHAAATRVEITIENLQDRLILTVEDNGCGFDLAQVSPTNLGLSVMRERTQEIGGVFKVESKIGSGTMIQVTWPIQDIS